MNPTTDTQRTDACPHCGSIENDTEGNRTFYVCGTYHTKGCHPARSSLCCEIEERNELTQRAERAEAEVERLKQLLLVSDLPIEVVNNHIDTPRTDAASFSSRDPLELMQTSQQLERELKASKAEVERLKAQVSALRSEKDACLDGNGYYANKVGIFQDRINKVLEILTEQIK